MNVSTSVGREIACIHLEFVSSRFQQLRPRLGGGADYGVADTVRSP